jgi:hypothetical protein
MALEGDTLATARVKLVADARGLPADVRSQAGKGLGQEAERQGSQFGKRMTAAIGAAVAVGAAIVGKKLVTGIRQSIDAASDLNETTSKVSVIFGKGAADIQKFADTAATALGQSKQEALDAAATFAVFGKGANLTGKDLVKFSTGLTKTATDMASFSNTTPTEAISAIGSALRGEFDPIERYGVLLNETNVKAEALSLGLLKGSVDQDKVRAAQLKAIVAQKRYNEAVKEHGKNSREAQSAQAGLINAQGKLKEIVSGATGNLTAQQKVLAVNSLITKQTSDAQGDFARTSAGLANQQRILSAQFQNMKASIGQALLPIFLRLVTVMTTKVMPTLKDLWDKNGPAVIKFLDDAAKKFGDFVASIDADTIRDWGNALKDTFNDLKEKAGPALASIRDNIGPAGDSIKNNLIPALKDLKDNGGNTLADGLKVTGTVLKFLADHTDLLAKALPILVSALVAYKIAQVGANVAMALSPVFRVAELLATRQQTAAITANTVARAGETAAVAGATTAIAVNTGAQNAGILARGRALAGLIAQKVAQAAAAVATGAMTAAQWLLNAALTANPIGIVVAAIVALIAIVVLAYQKNETFRKIVDAVWKAIKIAIKATVDWIVNTAWPFIKKIIDFMVAYYRFLWNAIKIVWNGIRDTIKTVVDKVATYFNTIKTLITVTIPNAFKTGVAAIGKFWKGLEELARKPIVFVVGIVNKLIGGYNKIASVFKAPTAPLIPGFAGGGRIPGPESAEDNMLAAGPGGNLMKVATGEFIVNARQTSKNLPLLHAINSADGFADGGLVGGILDFFKDPAKFIRGLGGGINDVISRFGDSGIAKMLVGMGKGLIDAVVNKAKGLFGSGGGGGSGAFGAWPSSPGAQRGDSGVWRGVVAMIRSTGPISGAFGNAYRPGDPKWHGSGRAVDWMGFNQDALATYLSTRNPLELIHRTRNRDYAYTRGRNKGSFNNALMEAHRNHIHIAMRNGGYLSAGGPRSYDMGGYWPSGTLGYNGSGRTEHVTAAGDRDEQTALLARIADLLEVLAPAVGETVGRALLGTVPATRVAARQAGRRPAFA